MNLNKMGQMRQKLRKNYAKTEEAKMRQKTENNSNLFVSVNPEIFKGREMAVIEKELEEVKGTLYNSSSTT